MIVERYLTKQQVEDEACRVLADYARETGDPLAAPVDVDLIGEILFGLHFDWDEIEEPLDKFAHVASDIPASRRRDLVVLGGLYPRSRRVVLNEKHQALFAENRGLERFTKGHEIGHWVLHIDQAALAHPSLSLFDDEAGGSDGGAPANESIICRDGDDTWIERQANWFSAALLMPKELFVPAATGMNLGTWPAQYELATRFDVTISALVVRLQQFGLAYVDDARRIFRSAAEAGGQMRLRK